MHHRSKIPRTRRWVEGAVALAAVCGLAGCAVSAPPSAEPKRPDPLTGTAWQLVEIRAAAEGGASVRPADPALYTLAFGGDGRLSTKLDCNRGTGPWSAEPGADGRSGALKIGPLAVTRALCPPPSLDERIARDLDSVRGFEVRDGRLLLELGSGERYVWEPPPPENGGTPSPR